jgi:hypothetical protein
MSNASAIRHGRGGAPDQASPERTELRIAWTLRQATEPADLHGLTVRQALARLDDVRVHEIRRQIAAGTYLTEAKLNTAIDRLVAALEDGADATGRAIA